MRELSQAERTAMEATVEREEAGTPLTVRGYVRRTWLAARDYYAATGPNSYWAKAGLDYKRWLEEAEERERVLREALNRLFDAARPYLDNAAPHEQLFNGDDLRNFEALSGAIVQADAALAASPGEPEGQRDGIARATSLVERYGEAIISISAALNADGLNDKGRIMRVRGVIAGLDKSQPDHGPGEPDERPTWNLFCPECEQTSVDMGDGSCETCGAQTVSVVQAGESNE